MRELVDRHLSPVYDDSGSFAVTLDDGSTLGVHRCGVSPQEAVRVVLYFHGMGCSRLEVAVPQCQHYYLQHQFCILGVDRPGYGLSSVPAENTEHSRESFAAKVEHLLDVLEVSQQALISIVGFSSGGPYAMECAARWQRSVDSVACIAAEGPQEEYPLSLWWHMRYGGVLLKAFYALGLVDYTMLKQARDRDAKLRQEGIDVVAAGFYGHMFRAACDDRKEALRRVLVASHCENETGIEQAIQLERLSFNRPWLIDGVSLFEAIPANTRFYFLHAERDALRTPQVSHYLADRIRQHRADEIASSGVRVHVEHRREKGGGLHALHLLEHNWLHLLKQLDPRSQPESN
ncbi:MAG: hypothetical protein MHM6MM_003337 [Cercozoa sp. M6MM]